MPLLSRWFPPKTVPLPPAEPDPAPLPWSGAQRVGFRFLFAYTVLYLFPIPTAPLVPWVGKHLFHAETTVAPSGSGDTTYSYVLLFCTVAGAAMAALFWSLVDRKRTRYPFLAEWLRVGVRYGLALILIGYGAAKVVPTQFPAPDLDRLVEPFGQASPMGLMWTFMGASAAYSIFGGALEMACGFLLVNRRTTLLGSLLCAGVMANVVALNFCYDVPVKLLSSHLLLAALGLAAPDAARLFRFFVLNQAAPAAPLRSHFRRNWMNRTALGIRAVVVLGMTGATLYYSSTMQAQFNPAKRPPLYGIWRVQSFEATGNATPERWRRVVFGYPGRVGVYTERDTHDRFVVTPDKTATETSGVLHLTRQTEPGWAAHLTYQRKNDTLFLQGDWNKTPLTARLQREPAQNTPLLSRGFHWINEFPFNR